MKSDPLSIAQLEAADFIARGAQPIPKLYGGALVAAAQRDTRICCLTADLASPTETDLFRDALPGRFYQMGIAEANMVGVAAGMARCGRIPFVHSFCVFASKRCYDQLTMQVAYPRLPVKVVGFLPGLSTLLGVSHQAIEDLALMRAMPNMAVIEPSGPECFAAAVEAALAHPGPVYLRMKRPESAPTQPVIARSLTLGRSVLLREGGDASILAVGMMVPQALTAAELLATEGIHAAVADMASIKPLDVQLVLRLARTSGALVTAENHTVIGGLGSAVAELIAEAGLGVAFERLGLQDCFAEGASTPYLFRKYGLDAPAIAQAVRAVARRKMAHSRT